MLRGGRITPGEREHRNGLRLRFVYPCSGPSLLVAEGRQRTMGHAVRSRSKTDRGAPVVLNFLLVTRVELPKSLGVARATVRTYDALTGLLVSN